jgi:SAM-dependent methyltransferase
MRRNNAQSSRVHDDFLNPTALRRLEIQLSRRAILDSLTEQLPNFYGTMLDVGCGRMPYKPILLAPPSHITNYIGLDLREGQYSQFGPFDLEWDGQHIPLADDTVDCAMATEVLEQCPDPGKIIQEVLRVLKPTGRFFFTVPFLWPIHDPPQDQHRLTPFALERLFRDAGFADLKLRIFGGWDASLAQMIALWVRRRPMRRQYRWALTAVAWPLVRFLTKIDRVPTSSDEFGGTVMITGMSGTALKNG